MQSSNEELETSREEIQSVNEEMGTVNAQLSTKLDELDRANSDLKNLFESTKGRDHLPRPSPGHPRLHAGGRDHL
jgi:peptidoglycan hydrolase CwlO-like protein